MNLLKLNEGLIIYLEKIIKKWKVFITNFINKNISFEKIFLNFKINYKFKKISFSIKSTKSTFRKKIFCKKIFWEY